MDTPVYNWIITYMQQITRVNWSLLKMMEPLALEFDHGLRNKPKIQVLHPYR